jgi:hypothetical protein
MDGRNMESSFTSHHFSSNGKDNGGQAYGRGFAIFWKRDAGEEPGVTPRTILNACCFHIMSYQSTAFACEENLRVINLLSEAIELLPEDLPTVGYHGRQFITNEGAPDGGVLSGDGITVCWQRGALKNEDGTTNEPNGAFLVDVLNAVLDRLEFYKRINATHLYTEKSNELVGQAVEVLRSRIARREQAGTLGSHVPN